MEEIFVGEITDVSRDKWKHGIRTSFERDLQKEVYYRYMVRLYGEGAKYFRIMKGFTDIEEAKAWYPSEDIIERANISYMKISKEVE